MTDDRISKLISVDGKALPPPSSYQLGIQDVSAAESGRTQDAKMHKNRVAVKRKIELAWNGLSPEDTSLILKAFSPEYFNVRYWDLEENDYMTKEFYCGDRTSNIKIWCVGRKVIETLSFNIIEV